MRQSLDSPTVIFGVGLRRRSSIFFQKVSVGITAYLYYKNGLQGRMPQILLVSHWSWEQPASMTNSTANNSSTPNACYSLACEFTRGQLNFIAISLFCIAAISLLGNIPILISILFSPKRRNSSNLTTLNLVVSDLLITIFCIPFVTLDLYVFDSWIFGSTMCSLVTFVQNTAVLASLMNLLTITCEKFLAVRFPFNVRLRKKLVCHFMPVAWIIALAESIFYVQYKKLAQVGENKFHCEEEWPDSGTYRNAIIAKLTLFFSPLILITTLHSITIYTLVIGRRKFHLQLHRSERDSFRKVVSKNRRHRKAVKIILLTLISIIICWGPVYTFFLLFRFDFSKNFSPASVNIGYTICIWLLFSHCSVFPLIYFFFTHKGKETIALCFLCLRTCRLRATRSNMGSLLLDSSNNQGGSTRTTGRYSSWRRNSAPVNETRL